MIIDQLPPFTADHVEGVIFAIAALIAAFEIPHSLHVFRRWLSRRLKPLVDRPRLWGIVFQIAIGLSLIIIPIHALALAMEASSHLSA